MLFSLSSDMKKSILGHLRNMPTDIKDPSWMLTLPLIHLVFGQCKPFEELKEDLTHDDYKPVWWGIDEISSTVTKFMDIPRIEIQ